MSFLTYPPNEDDVVIIDGKEYEINMAYDNILRVYEMLNDKTLDDAQQIVLGLAMLIGNGGTLPFSLKVQEEVLYRIFQEKLGQGEERETITDIAGNPMPNASAAKGDNGKEKTMSLTQDAEYIFASFMQDYGIDLWEERGKMHWNKFMALLSGLSENTKLMKVIEIRTMDLPKKGKEREKVEKAKKQYKLKPE